MKTKLLLLALVICCNCWGQKDSALEFTGVVTIDSVNKSELFNRGRMWLNDAFKSGKDVSQIIDKENGLIAGNGILTSYMEYNALGKRTAPTKFTFSFKLYFKDGKYRYNFYNFVNTDITPNNSGQGLGLITSSNETKASFSMVSKKKMNEYYLSVKNHLIEEINRLISTMKTSVLKSSIADF